MVAASFTFFRVPSRLCVLAGADVQTSKQTVTMRPNACFMTLLPHCWTRICRDEHSCRSTIMSIAAASVQVLDASVPVRRIWECPIPVIRGAMVDLTGNHQAAEFSVVLDD